MPHRTDIEWADYSSNPLRARNADGKAGWSCAKISPGCLHCYSSTLNGRFGNGLPFSVQGTRDAEHYLDEKELRHILTFRPKGPYKGGTARPKVFPFDMTDVFGDWVDLENICTLLGAFALRPDVDFLLLTKRPQRIAEIFNTVNVRDLLYDGIERAAECGEIADFLYDDQWPLPNVWVGTSCEDQQRADERIPWLLKTPAAVRFLSCEPLLEAVDLTAVQQTVAPGFFGDCLQWHHRGKCHEDEGVVYPRVDWVIVGGESGHGARPCNINWIRSIAAQCRAASVPVFVKQLGSNIEDGYMQSETWMNLGASEIVGMAGKTFVKLQDKKGGDWNEWPADLRVREFPEVQHA